MPLAGERLRAAIGGRPLPLALVDLEALEHNLDWALGLARASGKRLRLASKSVRSVGLLRHLADRTGERLAGVMCYCAAEAERLAERGFTALLVAYPSAQPSDAEILAGLAARGVEAAITLDDAGQLALFAQAARRAGGTIPVVLDLDVSLRALGGRVHLGVRRSPLHSAEALVRLAEQVAETPGLRFAGLMGYEAQIAGLTDAGRFAAWQNPAKRWLKRLSQGPVEALRREVVAALGARGLPPALVNGGGTGSLSAAAADPCLTELTVGSGFLAGRLFSEYAGLELEPAAYFALQVVRRPAPGFVTCLGGGYVASGEAGPHRLPEPVWPPGLALLPREGAGEVQTPLSHRPGTSLALGEAVLFRHAKSGELAEHFERYLLVRGEGVEGEALTYRGEGWCFLG